MEEEEGSGSSSQDVGDEAGGPLLEDASRKGGEVWGN